MYEVVGTQFCYMDGERLDGSGGMDSWKRLQQCVWRPLVLTQENHDKADDYSYLKVFHSSPFLVDGPILDGGY